MLDAVYERDKRKSRDQFLSYQYPVTVDEVDTLNLSVQGLKKLQLEKLLNSNKDNLSGKRLEKQRTSLEGLCAEFEKPFPFSLTSSRRRNFSSVDLQSPPGSYSPKCQPFKYNEAQVFTKQPDTDDPVYMEVCDIMVEKPKTGITSQCECEQRIVQVRKKDRNRVSKHKRHLKRIKHQPTLQTGMYDSHCSHRFNH